MAMHKKFYASGFLYYLPTQRILLHQQTSSSSTLLSPWRLFGSLYTEKEEPETVFKNIIHETLSIKIGIVNTVYSYFNTNTNTNQVIVYSELKTLKNFSSKNGLTFVWFSFKEVIKLQITEQTKHDIVVGHRVIEAAARKSRGEHTFQ